MSHINQLKTGKPLHVTGYRWEKEGHSNYSKKFYSKGKEYVLSYIRAVNDIPSDVSDYDIERQYHIKKESFKIGNPLYVELSDDEFADEKAEKPFTRYALENNYDSVVFHNEGDEIYALFTDKIKNEEILNFVRQYIIESIGIVSIKICSWCCFWVIFKRVIN